MKLKLDENLSQHLKHTLAEFQHDVLTAADQGLLSKPDMVIGEAVKREGRVLLTLDLEFADLRKYPPGHHPGIILFRPRSFGPPPRTSDALRTPQEICTQIALPHPHTAPTPLSLFLSMLNVGICLPYLWH